MFLKKNSLFYYFCVGVVIWATFSYWFSPQHKKKAETAKPKLKETSINIDMENLQESINEISKVMHEIKEVKDEKNEKLPKFSVYHKKTSNSENKISLCENGYIIDVKVYGESGNLLYKNKNLNISSFAQNKNFYNLINQNLTLKSEGDMIEIFSENISDIPKFMVPKGAENSGSALLNITIQKLTGKVNFNKESANSFIMLKIKDDKTRPPFKFFCKNEVDLSLETYLSNGKFIKKTQEKIILGRAKTEKEKVLEYLILNSTNGQIDAVVKANIFDASQKDDTIILKGTISKKE